MLAALFERVSRAVSQFFRPELLTRFKPELDAFLHLLIFRFLAALGIGGEWAVGASLLAETWPKSWRSTRVSRRRSCATHARRSMAIAAKSIPFMMQWRACWAMTW